jgi:eukaryotic-like serine/threonine-protein kinase
MRLAPGTHLGGYEVVSALGAGGMGEVYRAHDAALDRDVAVKIVHPQFCDDPDRVARFRREARTLAALTHPHVAVIHEFGECAGICFLVMELVPGETLDAKLSREALALPEALDICGQIAAALEAAHEKGIVHRDLKPANIKVTPDGQVKVLDFGLAKALDTDSGTPVVQATTFAGSEAGVVLGTAAYMSPEQARGRPLDRRTDIWAFGCVLFEVLTGRRAFPGATMSDTIAGILERQPEWALLPAETPPAIHRLLRRCLVKDPTHRLRDIGDARLEIEEASSAPQEGRPDTRAWQRRWIPIGSLVVGALAGAGIGLALRTATARPPATPAHFMVRLSNEEPLAGLDFPAVAISPDGSQMAYVAARGGRTQLVLRRMNAVEPTPVAGTTGALGPFFSPDGDWIAFFAGGKLKKVPVSGGPSVTICDAAIGFGGSWGTDDTIVFSPATGSPLFRVAAAGGAASRVTTLDATRGEFSHRWPELLPDGKTVLFTVGTLGSWDEAEIVAQSLTSDDRRVVLKGGTHPRYLRTGHLLYARSGTVMVVPFDARRLAVTGSPARVLDNVMESFDGASQLTVSRSGTLIYVPGNTQTATRRLVSLDPSGAATPFAAPARAWASPRVSPDGRRLALTVTDTTEDIWIYDIADGSLRQLTFEGDNSAPIWMSDGERVTFNSNRSGAPNLFLVRADGRGAPERLTSSDGIQIPGSWSPDGTVLAFVEHHPTTGRDIWMLRHPGGRQPEPFVRTAFDESAPRFSPDGLSVAYVSNASGRSEVYVTLFGDPLQQRQVSRDGGFEPVWAGDGRELFYRARDRLMAASVQSGRQLRVGAPRVVFEASFEKGTLDRANYDVTAGPQRFVAIRAAEQGSTEGQLHVLLNWLDTVRSLISSSSP